jgi:hypothetical protein
MLFTLFIPVQVMASSTLIVGPGGYSTIQDAINAASDGSVIKVKQGIYPEQVQIRDLNNLTITGDNATIRVPDAGMTGSIVKIFNCQNIIFRGFTIDGNNGVGVSAGAANTGGDTDTRFYGIFAINSSGKFEKNTIKNVSWHNGTQQGLGMYVYVTDDIWREVSIFKNEIVNFQKGGLSVRGPIKSRIHDNVITHWGQIGIIAGNGIQLDGGTTSLEGNTVSGSLYFDENLYPNWAAAGMLLTGMLYSADNYRIVNNNVCNNDVGIWLYDYGPGITNAKVISNTISDNIWDFLDSSTDGAKAHANVYE